MKHFLTILVALTLLFCAGNAFSQVSGQKYVLDANGNLVPYTPQPKKPKKQKKEIQQNNSVKQQKTKNNKVNTQRQNNTQNNPAVVPEQQTFQVKESPAFNQAKKILGDSQGALQTDSAIDARGKSTQGFDGKSTAVQQKQGQNIPQQASPLDEEAKRQAQMQEYERKNAEHQASYMKKSRAAIEQMQKDQAESRQKALQRIEELKKKQIEEQNKSANIREQQEKGTHHDAIFRSEKTTFEGSDEEVPAEVRAIAEAGRLRGRRIVVRQGETPAQARMRARMEQVQQRGTLSGEESNNLRIQYRNKQMKGEDVSVPQTQSAAAAPQTAQQKALSNLAGQVIGQEKKKQSSGSKKKTSSLERAHQIAEDCYHLTDFDECDTCCGKGKTPDITAIAIIGGHCTCLTSDYKTKYISYIE